MVTYDNGKSKIGLKINGIYHVVTPLDTAALNKFKKWHEEYMEEEGGSYGHAMDNLPSLINEKKDFELKKNTKEAYSEYLEIEHKFITENYSEQSKSDYPGRPSESFELLKDWFEVVLKIDEDGFNTLAQNRTQLNSKKRIIIYGAGSDLADTNMLHRRAQKKMISQKMVINLVNIAEKNNDADMIKSLWNTYHCLDQVVSSDGKLYGQYCKNKFCSVCNGIRKADIINQYYPTLSKWGNPYFVTLTIRSVAACKLDFIVTKGLIRCLDQIVDKYNKRHRRKGGVKLVGIKSLECNFNPVRRTYNPHFHMIVPNEEIALILRSEWLNKWTPKHAEHWCQDIRKVESLERDLIETIKYGTKVFTDPEPNNKSRKKTTRYVYAKAYYNIIKAMKGHRLFGSFGFKLPPSTITDILAKETTDYVEWEFQASEFDWYSAEINEKLTGYRPTFKLRLLLNDNIDVDLE